MKMDNEQRNGGGAWAWGIAGLLALLPTDLGAAPAARVEFVAGNAVGVSVLGQTRALSKGGELDTGESVSTNSGRVQLRFTDGAYVSLQPQSVFRIDEYRYEGKIDGSERGFFSLLKGGLRTITGLVGRTNKRSYQVSTTVATIGIRGTEYTIAYTKSVTGSVGEGEIEVCSAVGCASFGNGQSFIVPDANTRPQLTALRSDLPPTQPGDVSGGSFQTANDSSKPNGQQGPNGFVAGNTRNADGGPASLSLIGESDLRFVSKGTQGLRAVDAAALTQTSLKPGAAALPR